MAGTVAGHKELQLHVCVVMVTILIMVDMVTSSTPVESLRLSGSPQLGYYVRLNLGNPKKEYYFLVDTGSSNLVIAGVKQTNISKTFDPSKSNTFSDSNTRVTIEYSQGGFNGYIGSDVLEFQTFEVTGVSVAIIEKSWNFFGSDPQWQGILGLAYDSLMKPSPEETQSVWTSLQQQHNNIANTFSLTLCPPLDVFSETNRPQRSYMDIGGVTNSRYSGDIYYTPIVKQQYYNVLFSNISVGGNMIHMECSQMNRDVTIVDSGTSEVFLNEDVFVAMVTLLKDYFQKIDYFSPPGEFWTGEEELAWKNEHVGDIYDMFPVITFFFPLHGNDSMQFGVTMPPQLYLRKVDTIDRVKNASCDGHCDVFVFSIRSKPSGSLLGNNLMNGYTVVFDRKSMRLGFAITTCELRDNTGGSHNQPEIIGPQARDSSKDCSYSDDPPAQTNVYVVVIITSLVIASVVLVLVTILYMLYCRHGKKPSEGFIELDEINNDDRHDNTINDGPTMQPAQEAGGAGDQLQVFSTQEMTTPTESSQSQCSQQTTLLELINKKYEARPCHSAPLAVAERGKHGSKLVGFQDYNFNLADTVA